MTLNTAQPMDGVDFESALKILSKKVWVYLLQNVHAQDVDDVYQEVCMHVYTGLSGLNSPDKMVPWMFGIARRRVQDYYRNKKRRPALESLDEFNLPDRNPAPFSQEQRLYVQRLRSCILGLNEPYREAATLFFVVGLTVPEMVEVMERNENTIKSWVNRCKPMIFKCVRGKP